jgi:hypothetical protein
MASATPRGAASERSSRIRQRERRRSLPAWRCPPVAQPECLSPSLTCLRGFPGDRRASPSPAAKSVIDLFIAISSVNMREPSGATASTSRHHSSRTLQLEGVSILSGHGVKVNTVSVAEVALPALSCPLSCSDAPGIELRPEACYAGNPNHTARECPPWPESTILTTNASVNWPSNGKKKRSGCGS